MRRTILVILTVLAVPAAAIGQHQGIKPMRTITQDGFRVQLDLSGQVLRLSVPEDRGESDDGSRGKVEAAIMPTLAGLGSDRFVSASVLAQKAKLFDDGLYAAVEIAAQRGAGNFAGKASLLLSIARRVNQQPPSQAMVTVLAGGKLGRVAMDLPAVARQPIQQAIDEFLRDDVLSKPIAFYTWSDELAAIFQQDRMLQTELKDKAGTEALIKTLSADKKARATYEAYLALVSRLTNRLAYPDLREQLAALDHDRLNVPAKGIYFFPPSRAHETDLVQELYGDGPIPEGFSLIDEMTSRIQAGKLKLLPTAKSGWYDYQTWALEPLAIPEKMPEAEHLALDVTYRKQLLELFKGILALTRETHIKQLVVLMKSDDSKSPGEEVVIGICPELSAEPLASYYFRRAWSYFFIRTVLEGTFGPSALEKIHRLTAAGPVQASLAEELRAMEGMFYGAHISVCRELGMAPVISPHIGSGQANDADLAAFTTWREKLSDDPDIGQDARMMVPVFYDIWRKKTKVWVFLGWTSKRVTVDFDRSPTATVFDKAGKSVEQGAANAPRLVFHGTSYSLAYPVTAEVYVTKILDRTEFREHCDHYKTPSAILANLK
jgi:hypothetical protein